MRQLILSLALAFGLLMTAAATALADSHLAPAATGAAGTTVTTVPRAGTGQLAMYGTEGLILVLLALAALMAAASIWQLRRA